MHIHPSTPAASGDLATSARSCRCIRRSLTEDAKGKRTLTFPDRRPTRTADTCEKDKKKGEKYDIDVTNKGETITGDPANSCRMTATPS